jgi:hypothetical protein
MGRCRKIPTFGPLKPHRQILNSDRTFQAELTGSAFFYPVPGAWPDSDTVSYTRFLASPQGRLLRRNRPVRNSAEEGGTWSGSWLALASVVSQNP